MKMLVFSGRTAKEILRDPLNVGFGLGFPLVLLFLMNMIQRSIPVPLFELDRLTPGLAVFGLAFFTLFSATLVAKDRAGAFIQRLYTTPLTAGDYILGYMLPLLPMALLQGLVCYGAAMALGLPGSWNVLLAILCNLPVALFFVGLGLLCGSILNDKQVGGLCGALLTNLTVWLSGTFFDLDLIGGAFRAAAYALPFVHGVEMEKAVLAGQYAQALPHLWWVLGYGVGITVIAVAVFTRRMKRV